VSVEQKNVVDFVVLPTTPEKEVVLYVSDHLDWEDVGAHIATLQAKVWGYLDFVDGGQLAEQFPAARGRRIAIEIRVTHELPEDPCVDEFIAFLRAEAAKSNVALRVVHVPPAALKH